MVNTNNLEIEKKFLIKKEDINFNLNQFKSVKIAQAFIYLKPAIRIRKSDNKYYITIKTKPPKNIGSNNDLVRTELETEIPKKCYNYLLKFCKGRIIYKTRYFIPYKSYIIELDIFEKDLKGLIYAEIEFKNLKNALKFNMPKWFFKDVTGINKYKNTALSICKNVKNLIKY